jgi:transposase
MALGRPLAPLSLDPEERQTLERWTRRRKTAQALALRARIILLADEGASNGEVAEALGITRATVGKWRSRFLERGLDGLLDEPRPGAPRTITDEDVERVVTLTLEQTPKDATHWSTRSMARRTGLTQSAVSRIWRAFALQPHRSETFKLSSDPLFIEKVRDIVGLYLNPPERALVLCVDEKSQIQALDRSQPLLPMRPGQIERRTHDYVRHGTTSLFAALNTKTGEVLAQCHKRHRSVEFKKFLSHSAQATASESSVGPKGFGRKACVSHVHALLRELPPGEPRGEEDGHLRLPLDQLSCQFGPVHSREEDVGEEEVEFGRRFLEKARAFSADSASITEWPAASRTRRTTRRTSGWSSTTRMWPVGGRSEFGPGRPAQGQACRGRRSPGAGRSGRWFPAPARCRGGCPPICFTMPQQMERPRPVPSPGGLVVKKGSKTRRWTSRDIPSPSSATTSSA